MKMLIALVTGLSLFTGSFCTFLILAKPTDMLLTSLDSIMSEHTGETGNAWTFWTSWKSSTYSLYSYAAITYSLAALGIIYLIATRRDYYAEVIR